MRVVFKIYRYLISPMIHALAGPGAGCIFQPSCSEYAEQAITRFGVIRGGWLGVRRVCRCHPGSIPGYDPIPEN